MDAMNTKVNELLDLTACRRDRFALLASVFARESSENAVFRMMDQAPDFTQELDESLELALSRDLASLACDDLAAFATKTRTEYARLFLGPRKVVVPMHESAHLSGTSRMFTSETLAVREFYENHGYVMKEKNREPEDSIDMELEFLRNICDRCLSELEEAINVDSIERLRRLIESQRAFKKQHLSLWAQDFSRSVIENDRSGYYAAWASFLSGVLTEDEMLLNECEDLLDDIARSLRVPA